MAGSVEIDFAKIDADSFEELCFELLIRLGFNKLTWRQGGADSGRDIDGFKMVSNGLTDDYEEKWHFECKHYAKGVPPAELHSKIAWADALDPDHLVFFVSSYISNPARDFITGIASKKTYRIHVIEGPKLRHIVGRYSDIVDRYFLSASQRLMRDTFNSWVVFGLMPKADVLAELAKEDMTQYGLAEICFLYIAIKLEADAIEELSSPWDFGEMGIRHIIDGANTKKGVLDGVLIVKRNSQVGSSNNFEIFNKYVVASLDFSDNQGEGVALYCFARDSEGEGVEIFLPKNTDPKPVIRYLANGARQAMAVSVELVNKAPRNDN
ncbi:restriction endonuclease [Methylobacterium sp. NMS14P]|uniref:restriction endonuclease n=1 Tax=Methylobacterium sp. NMS14P TaxID=2894310 RepID=UPI002359B773|nr:restriction endonuclease [Methylobacterium sp. NMS14P]WCS26545.1 restriction endonuclease [Methylobacterium sp. NMS14P]